MPIWLWKYGAVRIPPFHHMVKVIPETTPGMPSMANRFDMCSPTRFTPRTTRGSMCGFTGSAKGGMKMRAGKGAVW
jgi:hypothetical protein